MTRDELIEAMEPDDGLVCGCLDCMGNRLDAVLPLIADAIEAQERLPYAMQRYVRHGDAKLVRSFFATDK